MDKKEVLAIITDINFFYNDVLTKNSSDPTLKTAEVVNAWHRVLKDYEFDIVADNLREYIKNNRFAPTIADLINPKTAPATRYIPNAEETRAYLAERERQSQEAANDPNREEAKAKAQAEIRKMLGIERG